MNKVKYPHLYPNLSPFHSKSQKKIQELKKIIKQEASQTFVEKSKKMHKKTYNATIQQSYQKSNKFNINNIHKSQQIFNHFSFRNKTQNNVIDLKNNRIGSLINQYYLKLNHQYLENQKKAIRRLSLHDYSQSKQIEQRQKKKITPFQRYHTDINLKQKFKNQQSVIQSNKDHRIEQIFNNQKEKLNHIKYQVQQNKLKQTDILAGNSILSKIQTFSTRKKQDKQIKDKDVLQINEQILTQDINIQLQKKRVNKKKWKNFQKYYDIFKLREIDIENLREKKEKKKLKYDLQTLVQCQKDRLSPWRPLQSEL